MENMASLPQVSFVDVETHTSNWSTLIASLPTVQLDKITFPVASSLTLILPPLMLVDVVHWVKYSVPTISFSVLPAPGTITHDLTSRPGWTSEIQLWKLFATNLKCVTIQLAFKFLVQLVEGQVVDLDPCFSIN